MKRYYDQKNRRLVCFGEAATPDAWDRSWESDPIPIEEIACLRQTEVSRIVRRFIVPSDGIILEGGCGRAREVAVLFNNGYKVIGVDFAPRTVQRLNEALPQLDIRRGDVRRLDLSDGDLTAYISLGVIEHFWDGYGDIVSEMARVLKKGGYLFLSIPYMSPLRRIKAVMGMYPSYQESFGRENFHEFVLPAERVARDLEAYGFSHVGSFPRNPIKGFVDEIPSLKAFFWDAHARKDRNIFIKILLRIFAGLFSPIASHNLLLVFRKS